MQLTLKCYVLTNYTSRAILKASYLIKEETRWAERVECLLECVQQFGPNTRREHTDSLGRDLDMDGSIILKWILNSRI
jgi:hypothetical protein